MYNTKTPLFPDSAFALRVRDVGARLAVQAYDEDHVGADDFLGQGDYCVAGLIAAPNVAKVVKLLLGPMANAAESGEAESKSICCRGKGREGDVVEYTGFVSVELTFKPNPIGIDGVDIESLAKGIDADDDWDVLMKPPVSKMPMMILAVAAIATMALLVVIIVVMLQTTAQVVLSPDAAAAICTSDVECSTPRGTCVAGNCLCQDGFSGVECALLVTRFSPTISATSSMNGAVDSSTFRESVASLQSGVTADDVMIDGVEQTVDMQLVVPGPPQAFDAVSQQQMSDALMSTVDGASQVIVVGALSATTLDTSSGRRRLQLAAASEIAFRVITDKDSSSSWKNVSSFAASFGAAAAETCSACSSFAQAVQLPTSPDVTTVISYRVAPVLASEGEAAEMAVALMEVFEGSDHDGLLAAAINDIAGATLVDSVVSTALPAFVSQAFAQLASGDDSMFGQLVAVFKRVRSQVTSGTMQELSFGGWHLVVNPALTDSACAAAHLQSSPRLGDIMQDANATLPPGIMKALKPLLAAQLTDVNVTVCYDSSLVKLQTNLNLAGTKTKLNLAANEVASGGWQFFLTANAGSMLRALQHSLGSVVNQIQIPEDVVVVMTSLAVDGKLTPGIKIGAFPDSEAILATLDVTTIHEQISAAVSEGASGTLTFRGHDISMRVNVNPESGVQFGAALLGRGISLGEIISPVLADVESLFGASGGAVSETLGALLRPVLDIQFEGLLLAAKSAPPSMSLTGAVTWQDTTVRFEASLTKDPSWHYSLMLELPDGILDLQALGLGSMGLDGLGMPDLPSFMLTSADAGVGRFRIGNWRLDDLLTAASPGADRLQLQSLTGLTELDSAAMAELALARPLLAAKDFALAAMSDGLNGTLSYHGREITMFCKTDPQRGFVVGADVTGPPIDVAQALGTAVETIRSHLLADDGASSGLAPLLDGLSGILDLTIDRLCFQAHTSPPSLRFGGDITFRGLTSSMEVMVTQNSAGEWDWALSSTQDTSALLDLLGPVQDYVTSLVPSASDLSVMVSPAASSLGGGRRQAQDGSMFPPIRIGRKAGGRLDAKNLSAVLDLQGFVAGRLEDGVEATVNIGVPVQCSVKCTAGGLYMSAVAVLPAPIPVLTDVISAPDMSAVPAEIQSVLTTLLATGISSLELHIWTGSDQSEPTVIFEGELAVETSFVHFVFTARRPSSTWHFNLAVATDLAEYLWSRFDFSQIPPGFQGAFGLSAQPPDALHGLAVRVGHDEGGINFDLGSFADGRSRRLQALQAGLTQLLPFAMPSDVPSPFQNGIDLKNVPLGAMEVDLFVMASSDDHYVSVSVPLVATSTLADSLTGALGIDLSTAVSSVPSEFVEFSDLIRGTRLQNLRCHVGSNGSSTNANMGGLIAGTGLDSLLFQAAVQDAWWSLIVSFDVAAFMRDKLSSIDFLGWNRRRLQANGQPAFLLSKTQGGITASLGVSNLSSEILAPTPGRSVPGLASICRPGQLCDDNEIVHPLTFDYGGAEVEVSIAAIFATAQGETPASNGVVVQVSVANFSLAEIVGATVVGSNFGGDCPAVLAGLAHDATAAAGALVGAIGGVGFRRRSLQGSAASSAMYCQLHTMLTHVSIESAFVRVMMADADDGERYWSAELAIAGLSFGEALTVDLRFSAVHRGDSSYGASLHFDQLSFDAVLRQLTILTIAGTHICDMPLFSAFCQVTLSETLLFYASGYDACRTLAGPASADAVCVDGRSSGIFLRTSMVFPPQFSIDLGFSTFTTADLQAAITAVIGAPLPTVSINLLMVANVQTRSLRVKASLAELFAASTSGTPAGVQSSFEIGTNPDGGALLTLSEFAVMLDASTQGIFPGLEARCRVDLSGIVGAGDDGVQTLSPQIFDVDIALLTGVKMCAGIVSPFVELDLRIEPAVTWHNPFGAEGLSLTLGRLSGGLCISAAGIPIPTRVGFYGGFSWGAVLSGWAYVELALEATSASQFFYGELTCALEPCQLRGVVEEMVGTALPDAFAVLEEVTLDCNEPNCRAWINMDVGGPMMVSAGSPKTVTNPLTQEEV